MSFQKPSGAKKRKAKAKPKAILSAASTPGVLRVEDQNDDDAASCDADATMSGSVAGSAGTGSVSLTGSHDSLYPCPANDCDEEFTDGLDLLRHQLDQGHLRGNYCMVCDKGFTRRYDLKRHIMSLHENCTYQCDLCMKIFRRLDSFKKHQLKSHGIAYNSVDSSQSSPVGEDDEEDEGEEPVYEM